MVKRVKIARYTTTACSRAERKTRKRTCIHVACARMHTRNTHTHTTHIRVHAYTAYKMNARRHTLDGDRTKLATGILTYRQIGLHSPVAIKQDLYKLESERKWLVTFIKSIEWIELSVILL